MSAVTGHPAAFPRSVSVSKSPFATNPPGSAAEAESTSIVAKKRGRRNRFIENLGTVGRLYARRQPRIAPDVRHVDEDVLRKRRSRASSWEARLRGQNPSSPSPADQCQQAETPDERGGRLRHCRER